MEEWYRQLLEETLWFTDKGTPNSNGEVIFRASVDDGLVIKPIQAIQIIET